MTDDKFGLIRSFLRHRAYLASALGDIARVLQRRAETHDLSKLLDDEFEGFSRINAAARVNKFGSPEYVDGMKRERGTIDLHFSRNRHHPERPRMMGDKAEKDRGLPDDATYWEALGSNAMTFIDVIEMVCDWYAASKGYDSTMSWRDSVALNLKTKGNFLTRERRWLAEEVAAWIERCERDD